jgi:membrane protein
MTATLFTYARWPLVALAMLTAVALLYWAAPNVKLPFKWITPGAVLFTVSSLALSHLFSLYVANFGSYNATYGALGGIVAVLVWFYLTAFILLLGAELNFVIAEMAAEEQAKEEESRQPSLPWAERRAGLRALPFRLWGRFFGHRQSAYYRS